MKDSATESGIHTTITYDRALWRSAMTGLWQSVVPPAAFTMHVIFWAVVWFCIGALTWALSVLEIAPSYVFAGLMDAAFLIGVIGYLRRTWMNRFWGKVGTQCDIAGRTQADFDASGTTLTDHVSHRQTSWEAIDSVKRRYRSIVIRLGIWMSVVPDLALPVGLTATPFQNQVLVWWRE